MLHGQIANIDITIDPAKFEQELLDAVNNYSYTSFHTNIEAMSTRLGKNMFKIVVDDGNSNDFTIIAEQDQNGQMNFHPLILQSINNSFYVSNYSDTDIIGNADDPTVFMFDFLTNMAKANKGTFAYVSSSGQKEIISHGSQRKVRSIALIDDDGNVFACSGAKKLQGDTEDIGFSVQKPIGEWLGEHSDIQQAIATLPLEKKMDYIGKWLIQARIKEEIESEEFMDIFRQAGIFGFSEPSVLHIYKLIM